MKVTEEKVCVKCSSYNLYILTKEDKLGLYCASCGKWQKWIGKKNLGDYKREGYKVFDTKQETDYGTRQEDAEKVISASLGKENQTNHTNNQAENQKSPIIHDECSKCYKSLDGNTYIKKSGTHTGEYSSCCDKWIRWIPKKELANYEEKHNVNIVEPKQQEEFNPFDTESLVNEYEMDELGDLQEKVITNNYDKRLGSTIPEKDTDDICFVCETGSIEGTWEQSDVQAEFTIYKGDDESLLIVRDIEGIPIATIPIHHCPKCGTEL